MNRVLNWVSIRDDEFFYLVNKHWRCKIFDWALPKMTHLGGALFTLSSLFLFIIFFNSLRAVSFEALFAVSLSHLIVQLVKKLSCRKRPYLTLPDVHICPQPLKDFSFPSGHTAAVFSMAIVFSFHIPAVAFVIFPVAILVAVSRLYLGLHYPTDCLIGAFIAMVSAICSVFLLPF